MPAAGAIARLALGAFNAPDRAIAGTAGAIDKLAGAGKSAMSAVTGLATSLTGGLLAPLQGVQELFSSIGQLVGLFNPAIVTQFTLAMNDTLAVLGSALVPVLQGMTVYVRAFGDVLAGLLPVIQPLFDAIGQYIANYAAGFLPIIQAAAPFIQLFTDTMVRLVQYLSTGVAFLQGIVAELISTLAELFGLESRFNAEAKSAGFAQRTTKVSSVQQFADDLFASSARNIYARQGGGKGPTVQEEIRDAIKEGRKVTEMLVQAIKDLLKWLDENTPGGKGPGGTALGIAGLDADTWQRVIDGVISRLGRMNIHKPWGS